MRTHRSFLIVLVLALVGFGCNSTTSQKTSGVEVPVRTTSPSATEEPLSNTGDYMVDIDPADFVDSIDNVYFPLEPGTIFRLRGVTDEGVENETIKVTHRTRTVMGVRTTVVKDVMRVDDELAELTFDWYAQDQEGNVWYFGEDTAEYADGKVLHHHGAWEAGVDGALPGIIMNADPQVTDSHRQEYYEGKAEDLYWVVATGESKSVPLDTFDHVIRTLEWTPLEPKVVVEKLYAPGVGLLAERALSGGKENVRLLEVIRP